MIDIAVSNDLYLVGFSLWANSSRPRSWLILALNPWLIIVIWAILIVILTGPMITLPIFWSRRKPDPFRDMPFESGQVPQGEARKRIVMQYYPYLLMFVVFDVVGMFMFAWGLSFSHIPVNDSLLVLFFLFLLAAPLAYALQLALRRENW